MRADIGYITLAQFTPLPKADLEEGDLLNWGESLCLNKKWRRSLVICTQCLSNNKGCLTLIHNSISPGHYGGNNEVCQNKSIDLIFSQKKKSNDLLLLTLVSTFSYCFIALVSTTTYFRSFACNPASVYSRLVSEYLWTRDMIRKHFKLHFKCWWWCFGLTCAMQERGCQCCTDCKAPSGIFKMCDVGLCQ